MSHLELCLLGPPEVRADGDVVDFPTRKTLALLAYLALEKGMQRREQLAVLFWPESDASRGRANLRNTLNYLRNSLPQTAKGETPHLHIERDALGFNADAPHHLDLETVAKAADLVARPAPTGAGEEAQALQSALDLYRGDFLEGFSLGDAPDFDQWATLERERWHRRIDAIFDRLSALHFDRGRLNLAQETALRWLEHDPLQESAYRRLMRSHLAAGERAAAVQAYERCRDTLAEEMGISPSPETEALAVRARKANGQAPPPAKEAATAGDGEPVAPPLAGGPMVGREGHFASLVEAYYQTAHGRPQILSVTGEAGIGKTRLAEEFLAWAAAQGADVLRGRSFESGQRLPYQPLSEALRPRVEQLNAPEDVLSDTWLLELSRLLPELLDRYPDLVETRNRRPQRDESAARTQLFEAVARLLLGLARRLPPQTPLVLFVDDIQWADTASLDLLQYAARRWQEEATTQNGEGVPILLLLAVRAEALHPLSATGNARVIAFLNALERDVTLTTVSLDALTQAETEQFLDALLAETGRQLVDWLFRETAGQPFYLVETLKDLREQGVLAAGPAGAWRLQRRPSEIDDKSTGRPAPERVRQVITSRLSRLSPLALDLLAAGAVLAQGFSFELLCRVATAEEGPALGALDELLRSQLLREVDGELQAAGGPYIFAHDKIRDVVYTEAGDARRRIFHRRALEALEAGGAPAARLAHHALAARKWQEAFRHSMAAGEEALAVYATQEAITHYEKARTLAPERLAGQENLPLEELYLQLGRARELAGQYKEALVAYDELQQIAREHNDRPLELAALMARTTVYAAPTKFYDPEHVAVLTEQALPLARELNDHAAEAKILWNLMLLKLFTGELGDAVAHGEESLAIAREHDLRERMAYALHDLIRAYLFSGRPEEGIEAGLEAQALWRELGNKAMLADNLVSTASAQFFWRGDVETVLARLEEALALSQEIDNLWNQSYAEHIRGTAAFFLGRFGEAIRYCEDAIRLGKQSGFIIPVFANGSVLAWIYGTLGQPARGFPWIEAALNRDSETQLREQRAASLAGLAYLHLCRDELEEAEAAIHRSYEALELRSLSAAAFFTFPIDGQLKLAQGKPEEAVSVADEYFAYLEETKLRPFRPDALYVKGRALLDQARLTEAKETLTQARKEAEALNASRTLWRILAALAEMSERLGNDGRATQLRTEAADAIRYIVDHVDDEDLQESFLRRPAVRAVLDALPPDDA